METLVIGRPAMDIYLSLQEFPKEGDIFRIKNNIESVGNVSATVACLLAKWGIKTHVTGVMGNDKYAEEIRNTYMKYKIDTKYIEISFENPSSINYIVLNAKSGGAAKVISNNADIQLTKYKYDFKPDWAVLDGTEYSGAIAFLNNNHNAKTVFYANASDKDTISLAKRCNYVVCNQTVAEIMTKEVCDGSAESCVNLYQKIVDTCGLNNFIVILNNKKILYSENNQVKMLPAAKLNNADTTSFDSVFTGAFTFAMILNSNLNDDIKFANIAASLASGKIGEEKAIPTLDEVLDNSGMRDKINVANVNSTTPVAENVVSDAQENISNETIQSVNQPEMVSQTQQSVSEPTVSAFNQAPVNTMPEQIPGVLNNATVNVMPNPNAQVQQPTPQVLPQQVQQPIQQQIAPQPVEHNMFDV